MNDTRISQEDGVRESQNQASDGLFAKSQNKLTLRYGVDTMPPLSVAFVLAFQHMIMAFTGCIMISLTLSDLACADINDPIRSKLFCSSVFLVGITTTVQNILGIRLPVFQGVSGAFIAPLLSMKTSGTWACKDQHTAFNMSYGLDGNMTSVNLSESTEYDQEAVYDRVREILLTLSLTSAVCGVLTGTGVFPDDKSHSTYRARTDSRLPLINLTPWFFFPYPGQFGSPSFNTAVFIGFLTAFVASAIESVGDYLAISRATETYPPPKHAINRGILIEGAMSILSGAMGVGHATTSISDNIVIVKITGIASRGVLVIAGSLATVFGVIGKVGAIMTSLPDPAIGGVLFFQLGMLVSIGVSMLHNVNLKSSRNLAVIGISIYTGLVLSEWIKTNPYSMDTGVRQVDQVLKTVLGTPMFTSGIVAIVLDNTVRGSKSERGLPDLEPGAVTLTSHSRRIYNVPMVTRLQTRWRWLRHLPFLQPYSDQD